MPCGLVSVVPLVYFNPRPPRGGRPVERAKNPDLTYISIHALREEGDVYARHPESHPRISIHALREEGDSIIYADPPWSYQFQSTPSARRATSPRPLDP